MSSGLPSLKPRLLPYIRIPSFFPHQTLLLALNRIILIKLDTNTINTMPLIRRRRIPLPLNHMPQMPTAITTHNLRPLHPKRAVRVPGHGARHGVEEGRPAAAGLELVARVVEGCLAACAGVDARCGGVLVVFAGVGRFGAFFADYAELLCVLEERLVWSRAGG